MAIEILLESTEWKNGLRNYFKISLRESYLAELGLDLMTPESAVRHPEDCAVEPEPEGIEFESCFEETISYKLTE